MTKKYYPKKSKKMETLAYRMEMAKRFGGKLLCKGTVLGNCQNFAVDVYVYEDGRVQEVHYTKRFFTDKEVANMVFC